MKGARRKRQPMGAGAGLEAGAIRAAHMVDIGAVGAQLSATASARARRLVGRIVEKLNAQPVLRPVELSDAAQRLLGDQRLVEDRDLQQHMRQFGVRQLDGLGIARAAQLVVEEAPDDDEIAEPDGDEDQAAR